MSSGCDASGAALGSVFARPCTLASSSSADSRSAGSTRCAMIDWSSSGEYGANCRTLGRRPRAARRGRKRSVRVRALATPMRMRREFGEAASSKRV